MKTTPPQAGSHFTRTGFEEKPIALKDLRVSPPAQREFNQAHANKILRKFDTKFFTNPEVSFRDGSYWIMDGQHSVWALKQWWGPTWVSITVDCNVYEGLTEADEAEFFKERNESRLQVTSFDKFRVALHAPEKYRDEAHINQIVQEEGLRISKHKITGAIRAVGTLSTVYARDGAEVLRHALRTARDAYGDYGLTDIILNGMGLFFARYEGLITPPDVIAALQAHHGGANGLTGAAEELHLKTGNSKNQCVAATVVTFVNRKRRGAAKLANWWK